MSSTEIEKPSLKREPNMEHPDRNDTSLEKNSLKDDVVEEQLSETTFPEGGARAWAVAAGCGFVLFATFGYVNAFG